MKIKTFKQFIEGVVVPFPTKKAPLSLEANRRGFFLAQKHNNTEEVLTSAKPLLGDMNKRGFALMKDGMPNDHHELKNSIAELHKATEHLPHQSYPPKNVYLNHGSDDLDDGVSSHKISEIHHHNHDITSFEDGYSGRCGIGLPKNFTHEHLKNHLTPKKT